MTVAVSMALQYICARVCCSCVYIQRISFRSPPRSGILSVSYPASTVVFLTVAAAAAPSKPQQLILYSPGITTIGMFCVRRWLARAALRRRRGDLQRLLSPGGAFRDPVAAGPRGSRARARVVFELEQLAALLSSHAVAGAPAVMTAAPPNGLTSSSASDDDRGNDDGLCELCIEALRPCPGR